MGGDDSSYLMKITDVGYPGGNPWDEMGNNKVVQIFLTWNGEGIKSMRFQYYAESGNLVLSRIYGVDTMRANFDTVRLNYPEEYITGITVLFSQSLVAGSITFHTNLGVYGPIGKPTNPEKEYSFRLGKDRQFGGFHGRADGTGVKSIGIYLKPIMKLEYSRKGNIIIEPTEDGEY